MDVVLMYNQMYYIDWYYWVKYWTKDISIYIESLGWWECSAEVPEGKEINEKDTIDQPSLLFNVLAYQNYFLFGQTTSSFGVKKLKSIFAERNQAEGREV